MFKWLFNKCEHDYKIIHTKIDVFDDGSKQRVHVLYCPKCDKEKRVNADMHDLEEIKKSIKRRYEERGY